MKGLVLIGAIAVLLEAMVEYGKTIYKYFSEGDKKTAIMQLITIIVGIGFAFLFKLDLFVALEIEVNEIAGMILTGIIISRGSNYVNDLVSKIRNEHHTTNDTIGLIEAVELSDNIKYPEGTE